MTKIERRYAGPIIAGAVTAVIIFAGTLTFFNARVSMVFLAVISVIVLVASVFFLGKGSYPSHRDCDSVFDENSYSLAVCHDCHCPIRTEDDDARICISCEGRNRRLPYP
ncbi:MAG: hypothetical protein ACYDEV_17355 [Acidiferrobacter sp.]